VFLGFLAIVAPLTTFVVGPAVAKSAITNSQVSFTKLTMTSPSLSEYAFDVAADVLVDNVHPMGGTINAMDADLLYQGAVLGTLHMPALSVKAGKENYMSVEKQHFEVTNIDMWNAFSKAMVNDAVVDWELRGTAAVTTSMLGLSMTFGGIPFHKNIPLTCLGGLDDVQMNVFDLTQSTEDEVLVQMEVCLKNPSDISIEDLGELYVRDMRRERAWRERAWTERAPKASARERAPEERAPKERAPRERAPRERAPRERTLRTERHGSDY
jgi:hypothetical protein